MYLLGGALYYIKGSGDVKTKVVCGVEKANAIFVDFHDSPTGAHSGHKKNKGCNFQAFSLAWNDHGYRQMGKNASN